MGRPRKLDRMSRVVTGRLTDEQYDWLVDDAVHFHNGDLSKALRDAISTAMTFQRVLSAPDPPAEVAEMIRRGHEEEARMVMEDETPSKR